MASEEVHELAVAIRPEGIDETREGIRGVEADFDDAADGVGDSAGEMARFARLWRGAMTAIVGGFTVAVGALLSQVPVVKDRMDAMGGTIEALALALDDDLRPQMQPVTREWHEMNAEIAGSGGLIEALGALRKGFEEIGRARYPDRARQSRILTERWNTAVRLVTSSLRTLGNLDFDLGNIGNPVEDAIDLISDLIDRIRDLRNLMSRRRQSGGRGGGGGGGGESPAPPDFDPLDPGGGGGGGIGGGGGGGRIGGPTPGPGWRSPFGGGLDSAERSSLRNSRLLNTSETTVNVNLDGKQVASVVSSNQDDGLAGRSTPR